MDGIALQLILIAAVTLGASLIQSITGFGFGIFAMIFLPHLLAYTGANALSTVLSTLTSVALAALLIRKVSYKNIIFPLIGFFIANYVAVAFIRTQANDTLTLLLGIALILLSVYFFFFSGKIKIRPTRVAGFIAGVASGILSGMFAIGGPPVVIYFLESEEDTDHYLATISAYFVISGVISTATKAAAGFITSEVLLGIAVGAVALAVGSFLGKKGRDKVKPEMIKRLVYGFMAISGVINVTTYLI